MQLYDKEGNALEGYDFRNLVGVLRAKYGFDIANDLLRNITERGLLTAPVISTLIH